LIQAILRDDRDSPLLVERPCIFPALGVGLPAAVERVRVLLTRISVISPTD
jgi:hypothetical protein